MTEHHRLGDRIEQAIEDRAEVGREIEAAPEPPARSQLRARLFWLTITGISLYVVAPSVLEVLGSWEDVEKLSPWWLAAMVVLQAASWVCMWELQRLATGVRRWRPIALSQLAGNALSKVAPGGGTVGGALQYRMLVERDVEPGRAVAGLATANVLSFAVVLALPALTIPALIRGSVNDTLAQAALSGLGVFVVLAALSALMLARDTPLAWVGRTVQRIRNRVRRHSPPVHTLPDRLLLERDRILERFGPRWKRAVVAASARATFDYATLLAAVFAVGNSVHPALILLAFCSAQLLSQIPLTPGGLGFVEAGLASMLALAGVGGGAAVLATFAYRLVSYWLPMPIGLGAWVMHTRDSARLRET